MLQSGWLRESSVLHCPLRRTSSVLEKESRGKIFQAPHSQETILLICCQLVGALEHTEHEDMKPAPPSLHLHVELNFGHLVAPFHF